MKCPHCEYERNEAFAFCPMCGKPSTKEADTATLCPTPHILSFIKDNLFLTICILLTVSVGLSLLGGNINVLFILITIFAWLTYAGGRKNIVEHKNIRVISGSIYAIYVINNVAAIITAVCGVLYTLALSIPTIMGGLNPEELIGKNLINENYGMMSLIPVTLVALISALAVVLGFILIAFAIMILVFNIGGCKKIHQLIKSIYVSAEIGEENIAGANRVSPWLIAFAVISILSAISAISNGNVFEFLSEGCFAAVYIIFNTLIRKHLCDK